MCTNCLKSLQTGFSWYLLSGLVCFLTSSQIRADQPHTLNCLILTLTYIRKQDILPSECSLLFCFSFKKKQLVVASARVEEDKYYDPSYAWRSWPERGVGALYRITKGPFPELCVSKCTVSKKKKSSAKRKDGLLFLRSSQTDWRQIVLPGNTEREFCINQNVPKHSQLLPWVPNRTIMEWGLIICGKELRRNSNSSTPWCPFNGMKAQRLLLNIKHDAAKRQLHCWQLQYVALLSNLLFLLCRKAIKFI